MVQYKDTIYAATQFGVFASKDWGISWEMRGENYKGANVTSIFTIDTVLMIATDYAVYFSYCFGGTGLFDWKLMFHNKSGISELYNVDDSLILFYNTHGSELDLFYSQDTGKTWERFFLIDSINTIDVTGFCHDDKYLYTHSYYGVWRHPRFDNVIIQNNGVYLSKSVNRKEHIYVKDALLTLVLNSKENVKIDIFSLSGRRLKNLIDSRFGKGAHIFKVRGIDFQLSNGLYILVVDIGGTKYFQKLNIQDKKM